MKRTRRSALPAIALVFATTAWGQITCVNSAAVPSLTRVEGFTEPVSDVVLTCTSGPSTVLTPPGDAVPQINITLVLNTNFTSKIIQDGSGLDFSEALLLIDEPNSPGPAAVAGVPSTPLLNCGNNGAPDNGAAGPGVCETYSNGNPADTYNGAINVKGSLPCDGAGGDPAPNTYGCGRPNAFAGRQAPGTGSSLLANAVEFFGVPFDPPAPGGSITLRFTNIRANANALTAPDPIEALVVFSGSTAIAAPTTEVQIGTVTSGMVPSIPSPGVVRLTEGSSTAFRDRNISFTLANATLSGTSYQYNGGLAYPAEVAQNVPGVIYPGAEDLFQWQNNGANAPPSPNPPNGIGGAKVANSDYPLSSSLMFGGVNTNINTDGVANAGTRVALHFIALPTVTISVPPIVYLHPSGVPTVNSGVLVLTSTDLNGAGPFDSRISPTGAVVPVTVKDGLAVYEVLYADPYLVEYADIPVTATGFLHEFTVVSASLAPFYLEALTPGANQSTPTSAHPAPVPVPRFALTGSLMFLF
jgi:hypothetical protein